MVYDRFGGEHIIEGSLEVKLPTIWTNQKQRWEESEKRRQEKRISKKRKSQKKEDPGARKGRKVAKHCVFPMICGSGGSKSRLAKAAGAEPAGQMRDEKLHAVVVRSTFLSQNVQSTATSDHFVEVVTSISACRCGAKHISKSKCTKHTRFGQCSDHFWKLRCRKSARCCGVKHISKSKCAKHTSFGALLEVEMSKKCAPLWREAHIQVKMYKAPQLRTTFWRSDVVSRGRCKGLCTLSEVSKNREGFVAFPKTSKNDGRRGTFEEDLQRCIFRGRRSTRDMVIRDVRRSGLRALISWEGLHFGASDLQVCWDIWDDSAWQVQHFVWPCITFSRQARYFRQEEWKNRKNAWYEATIFEGSLAELLRFWCCQLWKLRESRRIVRFWRCQVQKLRKSRRLAAFLMLSSSKTEEVSQNSFVFKRADRQTDRQTDRERER